jgi:hypothetical protein
MLTQISIFVLIPKIKMLFDGLMAVRTGSMSSASGKIV